MIGTWTELFQLIKTLWHTTITVEDITKKFKKEKPTTITQTDAENLLHSNLDKMLRNPINRNFQDAYHDYDTDYYLSRDPYYANLNVDDSMWKDVTDDMKSLPPAKTPEEAKARREELIKRIKARYGLL